VVLVVFSGDLFSNVMESPLLKLIAVSITASAKLDGWKMCELIEKRLSNSFEQLCKAGVQFTKSVVEHFLNKVSNYPFIALYILTMKNAFGIK
jgi:hypothetical protein